MEMVIVAHSEGAEVWRGRKSYEKGFWKTQIPIYHTALEAKWLQSRMVTNHPATLICDVPPSCMGSR